jgi:hypothetical protein
MPDVVVHVNVDVPTYIPESHPYSSRDCNVEHGLYSVDTDTTDSDSEITQSPVCPGNTFTNRIFYYTMDRAGDCSCSEKNCFNPMHMITIELLLEANFPVS